MNSLKKSKTELKGTRPEILQKIRENKNCERFFLKAKPGIHLLAYLLDSTKINRLYITKGILKTIPKNVLGALKKSGVRIIVVEEKAGRKKTVSNSEFKKILGKKRLTNKEKAERLGISLRTFYNMKKKVK
ncbi:hypothetical protein JXB01_03770 [Candidatus Micrarchaeota archaeon]|nr:hypothetical protein [Candidatus Micrarchaeota archaeon]